MFIQQFSKTISGSYDGVSAIVALSVFVFIFLTLIFIFIFPIFYITARLRRKVEEYKNKRLGAIIAQYDPPFDLLPAEVGLLYDMQCGKKELIATLYNLEIRNVIKFNSLNKAEIIDEQAYNALKEFETIAIKYVNDEITANDPIKTVPIKYVDSAGQTQNMMIKLPEAKPLAFFNEAVRKSLKSRGIPIKYFWTSLLMRAFIVSIILGILPIIFFASIDGVYNGDSYSAWSAMAFISSAISTMLIDIFVWPVYIIVALGIMLIWSSIAGRYWLNTKEARAVWPELEGYKKFIEVVDIDNIKFDSTDAQGYRPIETLPYAIVFNLETKWEKLLTKRGE